MWFIPREMMAKNALVTRIRDSFVFSLHFLSRFWNAVQRGRAIHCLGQVSARASPLPSQCLPVFGSFFCSVICPDILKDMLKDVCVCVHMHGRGTLNSNLQLRTADDHGHILTSFQAKFTTLSELAVEQSWHLYEICATSSWLRMFKSQRGQFLGSKTHTNGVYCLMSF